MDIFHGTLLHWWSKGVGKLILVPLSFDMEQLKGPNYHPTKMWCSLPGCKTRNAHIQTFKCTNDTQIWMSILSGGVCVRICMRYVCLCFEYRIIIHIRIKPTFSVCSTTCIFARDVNNMQTYVKGVVHKYVWTMKCRTGDIHLFLCNLHKVGIAVIEPK